MEKLNRHHFSELETVVLIWKQASSSCQLTPARATNVFSHNSPIVMATAKIKSHSSIPSKPNLTTLSAQVRSEVPISMGPVPPMFITQMGMKHFRREKLQRTTSAWTSGFRHPTPKVIYHVWCLPHLSHLMWIFQLKPWSGCFQDECLKGIY